ncbi:MAG: protein kinase [Deltaproteobacteria bacterium]|nr:protein kinase [Deltaproteobacteria bacterium]MBI3293854.1 protein kinase [Deltaproteobacteria bacterium]
MAACSTCGSNLIAGSPFCDVCGATATQIQVARKLRQSSFDSITDAKEGLLAPGERLKGKHTYIIEEAVARSGFGATFRAMRMKDEKQLLIKQMIEQSSYDAVKSELLKAFKREAKFLIKTKHPAFPKGYEYFERNRSIFLVMDFINGKELAKALEEHRAQYKSIEDGLLVFLGIEIADALEHVHNQGFIYRDLKPQNVMLDGISSRVKLIDFGTLYHASDRDPLLFESEGYTPTEFMDKSKKFLPSGDVYSLGALLFEAATGDTPKKGAANVLKDAKRDRRLCEIITKCLVVDPAQRFQKARDVKSELQKLTKKGFWPFRNPNSISPVELSVLPKTLYPAACTFCEFCGFADSSSQLGYCKKCRVPLKVGRVNLQIDKKTNKEFFLYSDETIIGSSPQCHFPINLKNMGIEGKHLRIFRRATGLYLETVDKNKDLTSLNRRKIIGPVELIDGDTIELGKLHLSFTVKDAC